MSALVETSIICTSCSDKHVLVDNECLSCPEGCMKCNYDVGGKKLTCSSCMEGYRIDLGTCKSCPEGCIACKRENFIDKCTTCYKNYALRGDFCEKCDFENCETCESDSRRNYHLFCTSCNYNYELNRGYCGLCPDHCRECMYNKRYICLKCQADYALTPNGDCIPCPRFCKRCLALNEKITRCIQCKDSYSISVDGGCRGCSVSTFSNCKICSPVSSNLNVTCKACREGYVLSKDAKSCNSCTIKGCKLCFHDNFCSICSQGYNPFDYSRKCSCKLI